MPLPTGTALVASLSGFQMSSDEGAHRLLDSELEQVYTTFCNTCTQFTTDPQRHAAWAKFLLILANAGFASSYNPELRVLKIRDSAGTVTPGPTLRSLIDAIVDAVPQYTHQRLSNSIPNDVAAIIKLSGQMTTWGKSNGLVLSNFAHSFPGARFCDPPPSAKDLMAISLASDVALKNSMSETISTALPSAMLRLRGLNVPTNAPTAAGLTL
jgi:hypothetical protein